MKKVLNLPLLYEQTDFQDERFTKVRVKVMHSGLNLNNSNFSDEAIGKAAPSLRNIPLLAFVKKTDGSDEADFAGHEFEFKITEDGIKYVYLGRPIGMIPETNNYSYEEDEEGVKFVSADAYVWNQYANEAMDIIQRDGGKSVSMEVSVDNYEVEDKAGVMDITDYKYTGITILGDDVQPAMRNARLDLASFSFDGLGDFMATFAKEIKETLDHEKPESEAEAPKGLPVSDTTIADSEDNSPESVEETDLAEEVESVEGEGAVEPVAEGAEAEVEATPTVETEPEVQAEVEEAAVAEPSSDPLGPSSDPLGPTSDPLGPSSDPLGESTLPYTAEEIVLSGNEGITLTDGAITLNVGEPVQTIDYDAIIAENEALKSEVESLRAFKAAAEKAELEAKVATLVEDFSDLPKEDVENIVKNELNYENIELKLYALRGRLNTKTPAKPIQTYAISDSMLKQDQPSWVKLVEEFKNKKSTEGGY